MPIRTLLVKMPKTKHGALEFVKSLIEKNHKEFDITFANYFANHAVHGICTLYTLGGTKERIEEYFLSHIQNLDALQKPKFKMDESNWEHYLTDSSAYPEYLPFFDEQISKLGVQATLDKFFQRLLPGLIGAAFHPLIQIGFGIEYELSAVVAEGLSYACTYYDPIGEIIHKIPVECNGGLSTEPLDVIREMKKMDFKLPEVRKFRFVVEEIMEHNSEKVHQLLVKWKVNAKSHQEILEKLIELTRAIVIVTFGVLPPQRETIDFFLIHALTSLHAVRVILPFLTVSEQNRLLRLTYVGLIGNYWLQGMPDFDTQRIMDYGGPLEQISWERVIETGIAGNDEHVWKVVRSLLVIRDCISNDKIPHEILLRAAFMTVDLIKGGRDWEFRGIGYAVTLPFV